MSDPIQGPDHGRTRAQPLRRPLQAVGLLTGAVGLAALLIFALPRMGAYKPYGTPLLDPRPAADFRLTGSDGKAYTLKSFRGKAVLIFFGFVNCPDVCPTTLAELSKVYQALTPAEQGRVQVLMITADPERDTPAVLEKYVTFFDPRFLGLTGTPNQVAEVAKGYGVFYQKSQIKSAREYSVDHTASVFLVDPRGRLRLIYGYGKARQTDRVLQDLRWVLKG
ncbi:SCO1 protein [Meiothermus luteus]|uniref:SCO1 protein n=2 Tax=Thermaceae TaxID=188786 RepID=A0A399F213_9DEIN|nr:SCO family protein [Meiothermus luteus]RIH84795.1 SCO1 protein [Meiothermus luteus]RIH88651.1 SCO1 protein [Calidithermus terrae]